MSLEETPSTIPENWIYIKGVSWKDIFHVAKNPICIKGVSSTIWQIWMSHEFDFKVKDVSGRDTFYNS